MPRVVKTTEFKVKMADNITNLIEKNGDLDYFVVAHANDPRRSFIVAKKEYFSALLRLAGIEDEFNRLEETINEIKNYISTKYKAIRNKG